MSASSDPPPDRPSEHEGHPSGTDRPADRPSRRDSQADRSRRAWRPRPDLDVLSAEPSLASLRWQGWQLDGLPTTSVAWAFVGALGTSLLAFGALGAALVIIAIVIVVMLTSSAVLMRDVVAARTTLQLARVGLLGCLLASAAHL